MYGNNKIYKGFSIFVLCLVSIKLFGFRQLAAAPDTTTNLLSSTAMTKEENVVRLDFADDWGIHG
jgi:hypothetical protein